MPCPASHCPSALQASHCHFNNMITGSYGTASTGLPLQSVDSRGKDTAGMHIAVGKACLLTLSQAAAHSPVLPPEHASSASLMAFSTEFVVWLYERRREQSRASVPTRSNEPKGYLLHPPAPKTAAWLWQSARVPRQLTQYAVYRSTPATASVACCSVHDWLQGWANAGHTQTAGLGLFLPPQARIGDPYSYNDSCGLYSQAAPAQRSGVWP